MSLLLKIVQVHGIFIRPLSKLGGGCRVAAEAQADRLARELGEQATSLGDRLREAEERATSRVQALQDEVTSADQAAAAAKVAPACNCNTCTPRAWNICRTFPNTSHYRLLCLQAFSDRELILVQEHRQSPDLHLLAPAWSKLSTVKKLRIATRSFCSAAV